MGPDPDEQEEEKNTMANRPPVVLERGHGRDGNPDFSDYVKQHPTNHIWRADIERLTHRLVNMDPFYGKIWVNNVGVHPPGIPLPLRDKLSFDVWGFGGRGDPLDVNLCWQVRRLCSTIRTSPTSTGSSGRGGCGLVLATPRNR
jgi:hypothetical protein